MQDEMTHATLQSLLRAIPSAFGVGVSVQSQIGSAPALCEERVYLARCTPRLKKLFLHSKFFQFSVQTREQVLDVTAVFANLFRCIISYLHRIEWDCLSDATKRILLVLVTEDTLQQQRLMEAARRHGLCANSLVPSSAPPCATPCANCRSSFP